MPDSDFDEALRDINERFRAIDGRCAARGEVLAANAEHRKSVNGDISEIKETLKLVRAEVQKTREAVATAKGVWIVMSMVVGAGIAYVAQFLPSL